MAFLRASRHRLLVPAVLGVVLVVGWQVKSSTAPSITFDVRNQTLGDLARGTLVRAEYKYASTGRRRATVAVASTNCGCVATVASDEAGGVTGAVNLEVDTRFIAEGPHTKYAMLKTNDPQQRLVKVALSFAVVSEFKLDHSVIDFGDVVRGHAARRSLVAVSEPSLGASVVSVAVQGSSNFRVRMTPAASRSAEGPSVRVDVAVLEQLPAGLHFGTVVLRTSSAVLPEIRVPIRVSIVKTSSEVDRPKATGSIVNLAPHAQGGSKPTCG